MKKLLESAISYHVSRLANIEGFDLEMAQSYFADILGEEEVVSHINKIVYNFEVEDVKPATAYFEEIQLTTPLRKRINELINFVDSFQEYDQQTVLGHILFKDSLINIVDEIVASRNEEAKELFRKMNPAQ